MSFECSLSCVTCFANPYVYSLHSFVNCRFECLVPYVRAVIVQVHGASVVAEPPVWVPRAVLSSSIPLSSRVSFSFPFCPAFVAVVVVVSALLLAFSASSPQRSSAPAPQRFSASAPQRLAAPAGGTSILLVFRRPRWQLKGGTIRRAQNDHFHNKNLIGGHNPEIDAPNLNLGSGPGPLSYFPAEVAHPCARPTKTHCRCS